jgi:hypothetical protein
MMCRTALAATLLSIALIAVSEVSVQADQPSSQPRRGIVSSTAPLKSTEGDQELEPFKPVPSAPNQSEKTQPEQTPFTPPAPRNPFTTLPNNPNQQPYLARLSRAPDLFGDYYNPLTVGVSVPNDGVKFPGDGVNSPGDITSNAFPRVSLDSIVADVPLGGGTRRFKNEHARALPTDRVFFYYNHFHNALEINQGAPGSPGQANANSSVDQFTLGFEKTFLDGIWSVDVRMPFSGTTDLALSDCRLNSDGVGNLAVTLKRLMYAEESFAIALGLAVTTPTGSDATLFFPTLPGRVDISNDSVHLLPYAAIQFTPDDRWFFTGFLQVDVAANGNEVTFTSPRAQQTGRITEQTLMYLDGAAGYWWFRSDDNDGLTGVASVLEFHYTTTLNDAPAAQSFGTQDPQNPAGIQIGNGANHIDVVNMTLGLHTAWWNNTFVRAAAVLPLRDGTNRFFDAEAQVSLIRRF